MKGCPVKDFMMQGVATVRRIDILRAIFTDSD